jgi:hypothetical protein
MMYGRMLVVLSALIAVLLFCWLGLFHSSTFLVLNRPCTVLCQIAPTQLLMKGREQHLCGTCEAVVSLLGCRFC